MIKITLAFVTGFVVCFICVSIWAGIAVNYLDDDSAQQETAVIVKI